VKNYRLLNEFQDKLHKFTSSYLNGGFGAFGYLFYPLSKKVSGQNEKLLDEVSELAVKLGENFDFEKSMKLVKSGEKNPSVLISVFYCDFGKIKIKGNLVKSSVKPKCREFNIEDYDEKEYVKPVKELAEYAEKNLKNYLSGFYVHGSIATQDFVKEWTDLDTFVIINKKILNSPEKIDELRERLYYARIFQCRVDPLQHHGHHIITEYDIEYYPESFMPIEALKLAKSLLKDDKRITFKTRDSSKEDKEAFEWFSSDIEKTHNMCVNRKRWLNNYMLKFLLHKVALYPSIYLSAKGKHIYKKKSFDMTEKDFSVEAWEAIKDVTAYRNKWKNITDIKLITTLFSYNPVLAYQINAKITGQFYLLKIKNRVRLHKFLEASVKLVREARQKVK